MIALAQHQPWGYRSPVTVSPVADLGRSNQSRRTSAPKTIAGAFFVPAMPCYGGRARETFGSAGCLESRFANLRTAATHNRLATVRGSSYNEIGAPPMHTLNPSRLRAAAHRRMAFSALWANSSAAEEAKAQSASETTAAVPADSKSSLTGSLSLISDYRFRGISQTWQGAAVQGAVELALPKGFYLGTSLSNVSTNSYGRGQGLEHDIYGGWRGELVPDWLLDAGLLQPQMKAVAAEEPKFESSADRKFYKCWLDGDAEICYSLRTIQRYTKRFLHEYGINITKSTTI